MYPFLTLDLSPDATDEDVKSRYRELVLRYPPDRCPEEFALIREAFEALGDRRARVAAQLFTFDKHGRTLTESRSVWRKSGVRKRLSVDELANVVRDATSGEEGGRGE